MIPKIIHYCWFGQNDLPELAHKCIASWKKYCPDYKIIRWSEDNFDISSAPLYVKEAYEAKKWAFVTDYIRLYVMTQYGGIYMDTDVELVKTLDAFLGHQAFSGFEDDTQIPTGIMACEKGYPLFVELLHYYDNKSFYKDDGTADTTTNVKIITEICLQRGLVQNGRYQVVDGFALYPKDVFCPVEFGTYSLKKTCDTVAIHWFAGSWLTEQQRKAIGDNRKRARKEHRRYILTHLHCILAQKVLGMDRYLKIRSFLKREKTR